MAHYIHDRLRELEKQLLLSPADVRRKHADRIEHLILTLKPEQDYSYEFVYFRATGFRPKHAPVETHVGGDLQKDLRRMLDRISATVPTRVEEEPGAVLTLQQIADRHKVAVRTVYRWRRKGLISRKYVFPDGRRRTGVRESALNSFTQANRQLVDSSSRFSRLSHTERSDILRQARELSARGDLSRAAAAERIARRTGRAKETVRKALQEGDREDPERRLFDVGSGPLPPAEKRRVYDARRSGQSVGSMCRRFGLSRSSIYRIINETRARELLADPSMPGEFIFDDEFTGKEADQIILAREDGAAAQPDQTAAERYAGDLFGTGRLNAEQEKALFRKYNYLKYRAAQLKETINPKRYVPAGILDEVDAFIAAAGAINERLVAADLELVHDVAKKHAGRLAPVQDLVNEGTLTLRQAIDSFDYKGRSRFGIYAKWALMKSFARTVPEENY